MGSPSKIFTIFGDPKKPEPATHAMTFPGGNIEVSRVGDDEYWAHISINIDEPVEGTSIQKSKQGSIVSGRVTRLAGVDQIEDLETVRHLAVKIKTKGVTSPQGDSRVTNK